MSKGIEQDTYRFPVKVWLGQITVCEIRDLLPPYSISVPAMEACQVFQGPAARCQRWKIGMCSSRAVHRFQGCEANLHVLVEARKPPRNKSASEYRDVADCPSMTPRTLHSDFNPL